MGILRVGHFTAMQVRGGAVRGLRLHLARLDSATRELFWTGLDGELVRAHVRHALGADARPSAPLLAGVTMQLVATVLAEVDDQVLASDAEFTQRLIDVYESVPWDPV